MGFVTAFVWRFPGFVRPLENWDKVRRDKQLAITRSKQYWATIIILFLMIVMDYKHEEELQQHRGIAEVCLSFIVFYLLIMQISELFGTRSECCRFTASLTMILWPIAYFIYLCLGLAEVHFFNSLGPAAVAWIAISWLCLPVHLQLYMQYFTRAQELAMGAYAPVSEQGVAVPTVQGDSSKEGQDGAAC